MSESMQKYQEMWDLKRRNEPQSRMHLACMENRKPHIYPCARGYRSQMWMCQGKGDCASARTPSEAYFKWLLRVGDRP